MCLQPLQNRMLQALLRLVMVLERIFAELEAHLSQPSVTDWAVLMVGYIVLVCLAIAGMSLAAFTIMTTFFGPHWLSIVADPHTLLGHCSSSLFYQVIQVVSCESRCQLDRTSEKHSPMLSIT